MELCDPFLSDEFLFRICLALYCISFPLQWQSPEQLNWSTAPTSSRLWHLRRQTSIRKLVSVLVPLGVLFKWSIDSSYERCVTVAVCDSWDVLCYIACWYNKASVFRVCHTSPRGCRELEKKYSRWNTCKHLDSQQARIKRFFLFYREGQQILEKKGLRWTECTWIMTMVVLSLEFCALALALTVIHCHSATMLGGFFFFFF